MSEVTASDSPKNLPLGKKSPIPWGRILIRALYIVFFASIAGKLLDQSADFVEENKTPAGFSKGLLHGALMPCAMPHLIVGRDVTIYAHNNNGRQYKLGYTVGVNGCGAIFFGFAFWRLNRWRKKTRSDTLSPTTPQK